MMRTEKSSPVVCIKTGWRRNPPAPVPVSMI